MLKKLQEAQEHPQEAATLAAGAVLKAEQPMELVERADKARALLFGMRDSDPGCTVTTWW